MLLSALVPLAAAAAAAVADFLLAALLSSASPGLGLSMMMMMMMMMSCSERGKAAGTFFSAPPSLPIACSHSLSSRIGSLE
jgi:hypothetical protein